MPRKPKYTMKDDYLLMMGVVVALMFQVLYDILHEFYFREIDQGWIGIQLFIVIILVVYGIITLRKMESYSGPI
jgi:uncharacterized membrane protein